MGQSQEVRAGFSRCACPPAPQALQRRIDANYLPPPGRYRSDCYTESLPIPPESGQGASSVPLARGPGSGARETNVKSGIHPNYQEVEVHCACGAVWKTRSTRKDLHLEICSNCHPFFTGRQKLIDTEGRVDRFTKKYGAQTVEQRKTAAKAAKDAKAGTAKKTPRVS